MTSQKQKSRNMKYRKLEEKIIKLLKNHEPDLPASAQTDKEVNAEAR